jgi:hypothetical protein
VPADSRLTFDLSGVVVALSGVPPESARRLAAEWDCFAVEEQDPFLHLEVGVGRAEAPASVFRPKEMHSELRADGARFSMPEGWAEIAALGRGRIELNRRLADREYFTLMNLLRACLAWRLPDRGAAMLHAAGLVIDDRAFLLVGSAGAGKSTWVRLGQSAGARVVSDDLVLVDPDDGGFVLLGAPFRSTHRVTYESGRWPLVAILFARHGPTHRLAVSSALLSRAKLTANLTFVADAPAADRRIPRVIEALARDVCCSELTFALDPGFVDLLRSFDFAG